MPIPVMCPECGAKMILPESALGQQKKCPECGDPFTVRSVNDIDRDDAPADNRPLHPGWKKVAFGYRMLGFALLFLMVGFFCTIVVCVATWAVYERGQVFSDEAPRKLAGGIIGGVSGVLTAVFAFLGHLFFLAMPADEDRKSKILAVAMLVLLFIPGFNGLALLLLPVFSAGVGTALGNPRLTNTGWNLYTWYAAGAFVVPMLTYGCIFGGIALGMDAVGQIVGIVILLTGWLLVAVGIARRFAAFRRTIEAAIRERGLRG